MRCQICLSERDSREINIQIFGTNLIICFFCEKKLKELILKIALKSDLPKNSKKSRKETTENKEINKENMSGKSISHNHKFIEGDRVQRLTNIFDQTSKMMFGNVIRSYEETYEKSTREFFEVRWDSGERGDYLPHGIELV